MWNVDFFRQYRRHLTFKSIIALRSAVLADADHQAPDFITLQLKKPATCLRLRPGTTDLWTFDDVFVRNIYGAMRHRPVQTMIDVGANIGLVSLYALALNVNTRILAVEPDHANLELLRRNLGSYSPTILEGALVAADGLVRFTAVTPTSGHVSEHGAAVQGYSMASIVARSEFAQIDVLKVDVEGAERHLFAGDTSWLKRVQSLIIEFHGDSRVDSGFDAVMTGAGYRIVEIGPQMAYAARPA
jgi:FkbM family methyltransferase